MTQQFADTLEAAIDNLTQHLVDDAQRLDPNEWAYISRMFGISHAADGVADAKVSGWLGRAGQQFRGIDIDDHDGNMRLLQATLADDTSTRVIILRVSRMPQVEETSLEVGVDYVELTFDDPVDVADQNLGGFSLFGDL